MLPGSQAHPPLHSGDNASNLVCVHLGEPELAIRAARDLKGAACGIGEGILCHLATGGDASNLVPKLLGEPQSTIRPWSDVIRGAVGRGNRVPGNLPTGADTSDLARIQ